MKAILLIIVFIGFSFNSKVKAQNSTEASQITEDICSEVKVKTDKFTGEVQYNSPNTEDIGFTKYKIKGVTSQYVSIRIYDSFYSSSGNKGLIILFKSGKKLIRSNEIVDKDYSTGSNFVYSVFFTPTAYEINLFKTEEIIGVKLYIFAKDIQEGSKIKSYANCVLITPKKSTKTKKPL